MFKFKKLVFRGDFNAASLIIILAPIVIQIGSKLTSLPGYNSINGIAYKDAVNWELCSKSLAIYGQFPSNINDWCLRRPIHIEIVSMIYRILNSFDLLYFCSSVLFSITLFFLFKYLTQVFSSLVSICVVTASLFFWIIFANNMMLSETLALILGNVASIYLLRSIKSISLSNITILYITLILVELIRPGNILIYIAPIFLLINFVKKIKNKISIVVLMLSVPFLYAFVLKSIANLLGYSSYQTAGNTWATIYGLANSNSTWQEAYAMIPVGVGNSEIVTNQYLKNRTLEALSDHPLSIFQSLIENFFYMFSDVFPFFSPVNFFIPNFFQALIFLIQSILLFLLIIQIKKNKCNFAFKFFSIFVIASSLIFYAASWKSEASRALAPTLILLIITIFCFTYKIKSNTSLTLKSLNGQNSSKSNKQIFISLLIILIPLVFLSSTMLLNRIPDTRIYKLTADCKSKSFQFDYKTVESIEIDSIRSFSVFSWSELIKKLPSGVLIQGLALEGEQINAYTVFLPGRTQVDTKFIQSTCFSLSGETIYTPVLHELNFREVFIP
jgi:hypothetical protein